MGRSRGSPENGFVEETLFTHGRECKKGKRRARSCRDYNTESDLKVNDLVLVRDTTSGAFAPRYMPKYRIVAIHGPNRIVVRDEKVMKH